MAKPFDSRGSLDAGELPLVHTGPREIVIPHSADARPVTAVKHVQLHMSLAQLKQSGFYERYVQLVDPEVLKQLQGGLAMAWTPVELALAHYQACENMMLANEELGALGKSVGARIAETTLVVSAKATREGGVDLWKELDSVHRMWARLNQGGSAQVTKLGPTELLLELRGFKLPRFRYYRQAQVTFISSAFAATGVRMASARMVGYSGPRDEVSYRFTWE